MALPFASIANLTMPIKHKIRVGIPLIVIFAFNHLLKRYVNKVFVRYFYV